MENQTFIKLGKKQFLMNFKKEPHTKKPQCGIYKNCCQFNERINFKHKYFGDWLVVLQTHQKNKMRKILKKT